MNHYEQRLTQDLAVIRGRIARVGGRLDTALADAVRSFLDRDGDLAAATILGDHAVNRAIREIDSLCHAFVARHLPSAGHLRFISSVLRMGIALERVGDYAVSIAREGVQATTPTPATVGRDVEMMAEQSRGILRQALKAFDASSPDLARGAMAMESTSDVVYRKVYRDLLAEGERHEVPVRDLFAHLVILGRLERIADQAKNVCEETIFIATGQTKPAKSFSVLFVDERNAGASVMAFAIGTKAFPRLGTFGSAGWKPAPALDPGLVEFMDRHGHDIRGIVPRELDPGYEALRHVDVLVALAPGPRDHLPQVPFGTVLLDWSGEVAAAGPVGSFEDEHREDLYKRLAARIRDLAETLHGEHAA